MKEAIKKLTEEQVEFILEECSIEPDELSSMSDEDLYDKVFEKMCDIEIDTIPDDEDEEESDRCKMASDIVTLLGNSIPREDDYES
jgi:CRISPR/Cas system-associated endonuclease/helicase Cas3